MKPLWSDPLGIPIVHGMLVSMACGVLMLRKIVRIRI
jgi:tight adherence protein B